MPPAETAKPRTPADASEADFWREQYERERERLVKLWIAYKEIEQELATRPPARAAPAASVAAKPAAPAPASPPPSS